MDNIRKKVFKNITNIIAAITAILAIILAIIKLLSYSYWKGYLAYFNISSDYIRLNNDNIILELVFYGVIILALLYFMATTYDYFKSNYKKVVNETGILKKIKTFIIQFIKSVFVSFILMTIINVPILWASIISFNSGYDIFFFYALALLYILEMFTLLCYRFTEVDKKNIKKSDDNEEVKNNRLATKILLIIIIITFIVAGLYKLGIGSASKTSDFEVVNNGEYIIAYKYEDKCILLSSEINNSSITIEKNKQKIVDVNNIEYEIVTFNNIIVK